MAANCYHASWRIFFLVGVVGRAQQSLILHRASSFSSQFNLNISISADPNVNLSDAPLVRLTLGLYI